MGSNGPEASFLLGSDRTMSTAQGTEEHGNGICPGHYAQAGGLPEIETLSREDDQDIEEYRHEHGHHDGGSQGSHEHAGLPVHVPSTEGTSYVGNDRQDDHGPYKEQDEAEGQAKKVDKEADAKGLAPGRDTPALVLSFLILRHDGAKGLGPKKGF